jgi:hypothetical protein
MLGGAVYQPICYHDLHPEMRTISKEESLKKGRAYWILNVSCASLPALVLLLHE